MKSSEVRLGGESTLNEILFIVHVSAFTRALPLVYPTISDLVVVGRILCSKLQLFDDDLIRPHSHFPHAFKDRFQVDIIQSPSRLANQSREHVDIRSQSCVLRNTQGEIYIKMTAAIKLHHMMYAWTATNMDCGICHDSNINSNRISIFLNSLYRLCSY